MARGTTFWDQNTLGYADSFGCVFVGLALNIAARPESRKCDTKIWHLLIFGKILTFREEIPRIHGTWSHTSPVVDPTNRFIHLKNDFYLLSHVLPSAVLGGMQVEARQIGCLNRNQCLTVG